MRTSRLGGFGPRTQPDRSPLQEATGEQDRSLGRILQSRPTGGKRASRPIPVLSATLTRPMADRKAKGVRSLTSQGF